MGLPLRSRVAVAFGTLSLVVAVAVGALTYELVRNYLNDQREQFTVARTLLDASVVDDQADTPGRSPGALLNSLPATDTNQRLLRVDGVWFSSGVSVSPDDLPPPLLKDAATTTGAVQRFAVGSDVYLGVAAPVKQGLYVEVFSLAELNGTLDRLATSLFLATVLAVMIAAGAGWWAAGRLLRPLRRLALTADEVASGNLSERMAPTNDRDLEPIVTAFNAMADSVQERIARERRFVANVSHELRTPVTVMLGTTEILNRKAADFPESEARFMTLLGDQVTRLARTVLDVLELGTITPDTRPQWEDVDVAGLVSDVIVERNHDVALLRTDGDCNAVTDPRRLERIVANLVDNADVHGRGLTAINVVRCGDTISISVDDRGPGVLPAEREAIFELFGRGTSSEPGNGSGLGLAIVAEQAQVLAAKVKVVDGLSGGARFVVDLDADPRTEQPGGPS